MASTSELLRAAQYSVVLHGNLSVKCEIKSREAGDSHWIKIANFAPHLLLDQQRQPMGKIFSKKFFTTKEYFEINTPDCHVRVVWRPTFSSFCLEGTTDVKGYETIDWKWKRVEWDSEFTLKNKADGRTIAMVRRKPYHSKHIGEIYIYETFPEDIKRFIVFSGSYLLYTVLMEELASHAT